MFVHKQSTQNKVIQNEAGSANGRYDAYMCSVKYLS